MPQRTRIALVVLLITLCGLLLRLWHLEFGLPSRYHPDEMAKVEVGTKIVEGKPVDYFLHPGFLVNTVAASFKVSQWCGLDKDTYQLLWSRLAVIFFAMLSIPLCAAIGWKLCGEWGAYFCGAALAIVPIHVLHSRYTKEDIHLTFGMLLALLMLMIWRSGSRRITSWSFAGLVLGVGLAASSKFVGVVMVPFSVAVVIASVQSVRSRLLSSTIILLGTAAIFLLFAHQVLGDPSAMWAGFQFEWAHGTKAPEKPTLYLWQWPDFGFYYFVTTILPGLGYALPLAGVAGWWLAARKPSANVDAFLIAVCAAFWYLIAELTPLKRGTGVERYALPAAVLLIPLAALAMEHLAARLRERRIGFIATGSVALLIVPLGLSVLISARIDKDTRRDAQKWIAVNGPRDLRMGYLSQLYMPDWTRRGVTILCDINQRDDAFRESLKNVNCFSMSSFYNDRYENFPTLSARQIARIKTVREEFPYAVVYKRPFYRAMYFHQPVIEIRFREARSMTVESTARP